MIKIFNTLYLVCRLVVVCDDNNNRAQRPTTTRHIPHRSCVRAQHTQALSFLGAVGGWLIATYCQDLHATLMHRSYF